MDNYIRAISNFYRIDANTKNIEGYKQIVSKYIEDSLNGQRTTVNELSSLKNLVDIIKKMSLFEIQYLIDNSEDNSKILLMEEMNNRLHDDNENKQKLKEINKHNKKIIS